MLKSTGLSIVSQEGQLCSFTQLWSCSWKLPIRKRTNEYKTLKLNSWWPELNYRKQLIIDQALISLIITTKLLKNSLDVQQYINSVTWVVSSLSLLTLCALYEFYPVRYCVLNFGNYFILSKFYLFWWKGGWGALRESWVSIINLRVMKHLQEKDWTWYDKSTFMISIVSDWRDRPLKDKRGLVLRDTSTKRRKEFNIANIAYDSFLENYVGIVGTCFPFNNVKKSWLKIANPSISRGLLKSINQKNELYKQYLGSRSNYKLIA